MDNFIYNDDIPGWSNKHMLGVLAKEAASVPEFGTIVEIGALAGRSSYVLAMNSHSSVKTVCIDPYSYMPNELIENISQDGKLSIHGKVRPNDFKNKETWKRYVKKCDNIYMIQEFSPLHYFIPSNLIFIDGDHSYEQIVKDLKWAKNSIIPNGVIILDDYSWSTGVVKATEAFVSDNIHNIASHNEESGGVYRIKFVPNKRRFYEQV